MAGDDEEPPVASLLFRNASHPKRKLIHHIYANNEFDIGRRHVNQAWGINELTISTHHLRFRCVMFENEDDDIVAPLIYVRVISRNPVILSRSDSNHPGAETNVARDTGDVLLNHGDVLQLTPMISVLFEIAELNKISSKGLDNIKQAEVARFSRQYQVTDRMLGAGGYASVFVAVKQSNQRQVACKIVPLPHTRRGAPPLDQQLQATDAKELELRRIKRENLAREYNVLKDLNHPNIICLEKVFCASYNIYIFQELITGGDLLSYINNTGALGEPQTAVIVRQIAKAVEYLHSNQIVHRDIKPENVLMTSWREGARVVLTDFGQARTLEDAKTAARSSTVFRMQSVVGTHGYTAPEVYQQLKQNLRKERGYSKAIDIWSIGCITATLLTNDLIFPEDDQGLAAADDQTSALKQHNRFDLSILDTSRTWRNIGRKAKSFIRGCLNVDESARLTAKQALLHEWFTNKHYASEIEAAYQRAIDDWKPRSDVGGLIEFINTTDALLDTRPGHVKRFVEETRSRHFPPHSTPKASPNAFNKRQIYLPPPTQRHTPIPAIGDDSEGESSQTKFVNGATISQVLSASPICVPNSPVGEQQKASHSFAHTSMVDFAPPETPFSLNDSLPAPPPGWDDSVNHSQLMLDDLSPPKYPSPPAKYGVPGGATCKKRTSSFADLDELDLDVNPLKQDFDGHECGGVDQRKRVCW